MHRLHTTLITLAFTCLMCCLPAHAKLITDTVTVDGKEWAQPVDFVSLFWQDINAVCPLGVCGVGQLNGFDMDGWVWADKDKMSALFDVYFAIALVDDNNVLSDDSLDRARRRLWADAILEDFKPTRVTMYPATEAVYGVIWGAPLFRTAHAAVAINFGGLTYDNVTSSDFYPPGPEVGVWFYRPSASSTVPSPSTLFLLGLGLLCLRKIR